MDSTDPKSEFTTKRPLSKWMFLGGILFVMLTLVSVQRTNSQQETKATSKPTDFTEETAADESELPTDSPKEQTALIEAYGLACSEQIEKLESDRLTARIQQIWTQAQATKTKSNQDPRKFATQLLLDNLAKAKQINAGRDVFSGSADHNQITLDISTELVAINTALEYLQKGKTPPSVDVNLTPVIEHCHVYGAELWQELNDEN